MLTLLKKAFSRLSGSSLLNRMSTQSSPALARIARGTLRALFARTAASSSLRTKSCPLGSRRRAFWLRGTGRVIAWIVNSLRLAPAGTGSRDRSPRALRGPCPSVWAPGKEPGRGWAQKAGVWPGGAAGKDRPACRSGVEVEGQPGVGSSGSVARPGLLGLRLVQVEVTLSDPVQHRGVVASRNSPGR